MCPGKWETQSRLMERLFSFIDLPDVLTKTKRKHIMRKIKGRRIFAFESTRASTVYGIRHTYITDTLTKDNYLLYAIVRDSCYINIVRGNSTVSFNFEDPDGYQVQIWDWKNKKYHSRIYRRLYYALKYANGFSDTVGDYPPPVGASSHIIIGGLRK